MMAAKKDHYEVLEVARDEPPEGIRKAFRRLAKECHPDVAGSAGDVRFKELAQAHEVLSDPGKRGCYDEHLRLEEDEADRRHRERWGGPTPEPMSPRRGGPVPEPMRDPFVDFVGPTSALGWRGREHLDGRELVELELVVTPREAAHGGVFEVPLGLFIVCPACGGFGGDPFFGPCSWCLGRGGMEDEVHLRLRLPAGLRRGQRFAVSLGRAHPRLEIRVAVIP